MVAQGHHPLRCRAHRGSSSSAGGSPERPSRGGGRCMATRAHSPCAKCCAAITACCAKGHALEPYACQVTPTRPSPTARPASPAVVMMREDSGPDANPAQCGEEQRHRHTTATCSMHNLAATSTFCCRNIRHSAAHNSMGKHTAGATRNPSLSRVQSSYNHPNLTPWVASHTQRASHPARLKPPYASQLTHPGNDRHTAAATQNPPQRPNYSSVQSCQRTHALMIHMLGAQACCKRQKHAIINYKHRTAPYQNCHQESSTPAP
jgi:hypothetical protein